MKADLLSVIAGTEVCNARCPFCISKMTPTNGLGKKPQKPNWRNFAKACRYARHLGVSTVMITGKGEPALFPEQITNYLERLLPFDFPLLEMQSNGILFMQNPEKYDPFLAQWIELGLTTIAISVVHWDAEENRRIYLPHQERYIDLQALIAKLRGFGFSVRLACILLKETLDEPESVEKMIRFARENKVEQLTMRPVNQPGQTEDWETAEWVTNHSLTREQKARIYNYLREHGSKLMELGYGAEVFDVEGQNVCFTNSLTIKPESSDLRQLIFFPDGRLRYDWQYEGALIF